MVYIYHGDEINFLLIVTRKCSDRQYTNAISIDLDAIYQLAI